MSNSIKILQNNIQSIRPCETREELSIFLNQNEILIASLQEIWITKNEKFNFKGYNFITRCREKGYGGVGLLIKEEVQYEELTINDLKPLEVIAARTKNLETNFTIFSVYVTPNRELCMEYTRKLKELFNLIEGMNGEVILTGDFNARHRRWDPGAERNCELGNTIFNELNTSRLNLLNEQEATTIPRINTEPTAVDLAFATNDLAAITDWKVEQDQFGSSHWCITLEIHLKSPIVKGKTKKVNVNKAIESLNTIQPQYIYDPEELQNIFEEHIDRASYTIENKKADYLKRWWSEEIQEAYDEKREKLKEFNKIKTPENQLNFHKARANYKRLARKAKRNSDKELREKIDETTPAVQVWNVIRGLNTALTGKKRGAEHNPKKEIAEKFIEANYNEKSAELTSPTQNQMEIPQEKICFNEFMEVLKSKKDHSAPGADNISFRILKNLRIDILIEICNQLNRVWQTKNIPDRWRNNKLILITKPNKDPHDVTSKRGIMLMNVFLKIINTVVKNRLYQWAEHNRIFPKLSFGFRKGHSAISCVNFVVNTLKEAKAENIGAIVIFLDLTKAFDKVNGQTLLNKLAEQGAPADIIDWYEAFLNKRRIKIFCPEGELNIEVNDGLAQGCPGSPTLFIIYTIELHDIEEEGVTLVQFADDFAIVAKGHRFEAVNKANRYLQKFLEKMEELNFSVNPDKCAAINYTKIADSCIDIRIQGKKIQFNNTHKYLGYVLDKGLIHAKHIEEITAKASASMTLVRMLSNRKSPANPGTMVKIADALVRSKLDYGSSVYGAAAKTHLQKIQTVANSYIRASMRYIKSTPVNVMQADSGKMPMEKRTEWLTIKETLKAKHSGNPNQKFIYKTMDEQKSNGSYMTRMVEKHIDIMYQLKDAPKMNKENFNRIKSTKIEIKEKVEGIDDKKSNVNPEQWKKAVTQMLATTYSTHEKIYTDGSRTKHGTAFAAVGQQWRIAEKTNQNVTITNAELMAIREAMRRCTTDQIKSAVILTDSKTACNMIAKQENAKTNHLIWEIYQWYQKIQTQKGQVTIQWIPSHVQIKGNELADQLANQKTETTQDNFETLTLGDAILLAKEEIWNSWREQYKQTSQNKGKAHYEFAKEPGKQPWFKNLQLKTEEIVTLTRIRSNHCMTKDRKHGWGWEPDDKCDVCHVTENLEHILYHCNKYTTERAKHKVLKNKKPLKDILQGSQTDELKCITTFLKEIKIQL